MVETIDRFGLKAWHLRKHKKAVESFFRRLTGRRYQTEVASGYKKRFEKNRKKLFTFLDYDGVPWNNNNAEHAIKSFVRMRNVIGANSTTRSIQDSLILLSVSETCKYKGVNFLSNYPGGWAARLARGGAFGTCPALARPALGWFSAGME